MAKRIKGYRKKLSPRKAKAEERSREALIRYNGELVEEFLGSEVYLDIIKPVLDESIASVDGKQVSNKWLFGEINKSVNFPRLQFLSGYSLALKEFANRILSFIEERDKLQLRKLEEKIEKRQPIVNPFLEDINEIAKEDETWS
jgi:hypothetical protein